MRLKTVGTSKTELMMAYHLLTESYTHVKI